MKSWLTRKDHCEELNDDLICLIHFWIETDTVVCWKPQAERIYRRINSAFHYRVLRTVRKEEKKVRTFQSLSDCFWIKTILLRRVCNTRSFWLCSNMIVNVICSCCNVLVKEYERSLWSSIEVRSVLFMKDRISFRQNKSVQKEKVVLFFISPVCTMFTTEREKKLIEKIVSDMKYKEQLSFHNVPIRNKILLRWKSWNWKTTFAKNLWKVLWIETAIVNTSQTIDSHMWNSARNIQKIFDEVSFSLKWKILFFDEFDSLWITRNWTNDSSAMTENNRMVNQLLVSMDNLQKDVIMICASNMPDCIDKDIMRRFSIVHEVKSPTLKEKEEYLQYLQKRSLVEWLTSIIDLNTVESFAEVEEAFFEEMRMNMYVMYN